MKRREFSALMLATGAAAMAKGSGKLSTGASLPNLLIIHTDEHNLRTLGCYRKQLGEEQGFVWGKGVKVDTPNLDRIANEGAICNRYYSSCPVCTPSRASFVTGLYPVATGSPQNDLPLNDGLPTFATVLQEQGYATSYVGKWHLDGDAKPGFCPARKFGFADNRYMMNRGHWKGLSNENSRPAVIGLVPEKQIAKFSAADATPENFTTDFLTSRALEILERDKNKPFCCMLSIPDPHGPNGVREPYNTMFNDVHFEKPGTMNVTKESIPKWARNKLVDSLDQNNMQDYFGMVKCIDDNVGRILKFLEENHLDQNTIVVFTSDHGDLMGEHRRHNKGVPYETSARIPFLIRWPGKIAAGKVINTPYNTSDFPQTILSMMGAPLIPHAHGINDSQAFLSSEKNVNSPRMTYITATMSNWTAIITERYKYVLSVQDVPWLFDNERDPDELINFAADPKYASTVRTLEAELIRQMKLRKDPALEKGLNYSDAV